MGSKIDLKGVDYGTAMYFGTLEDFYTKLQMESKTLEEMKDFVDEHGRSMLNLSLINRKFDIAKVLLEHGAKVNVVSKAGCNEFHHIAANVREEGFLEVAYMLLDRGVSLSAIDKSYGNTALFTLCMEIFKVRTPELMTFLEKCFEKADCFDVCNKWGYSVRSMIEDRGTDRLMQLMGEKV